MNAPKSWCGDLSPEHRAKSCIECQRIYRARLNGRAPYVPEPEVTRPKWKPSALNRRTTRKWERCQARGGCDLRGEPVMRPAGRFGDVLFPTCVRCGVPTIPSQYRSGVWRRYQEEAA